MRPDTFQGQFGLSSRILQTTSSVVRRSGFFFVTEVFFPPISCHRDGLFFRFFFFSAFGFAILHFATFNRHSSMLEKHTENMEKSGKFELSLVFK